MEKNNECLICREEMIKGNIKVIHKQRKKKFCEKWDHKFHTECINVWIEKCINSHVFPTCPTCNLEIPYKKIPQPFLLEAQKILDGEYEENDENDENDEVLNYIIVANNRLDNIERISQTYPIIFLCIMICMDGKHKITLTNLDIGLEIGSTMNDLKEALKRKSDIIYKNSGFLRWKNFRHNISLYNWCMWKYPKYKITNIHYGIPSYTNSFWALKSIYDLETDNVSLANIYSDYQTSAGYILENKETIENNGEMPPEQTFEEKHFRELGSVYYGAELNFNYHIGPDDQGYYLGEHSIAWLVVHME